MAKRVVTKNVRGSGVDETSYLRDFRQGMLHQLREAGERKLRECDREPNTWGVLKAFNAGRGFTFDVAEAHRKLGPEYELDPHKAEAGDYEAQAKRWEAWIAAVRHIAESEDMSEGEAWLHARDRCPDLYNAASVPPVPVIGSKAWRAAQGASLADYALHLTTVQEMRQVDPRAMLYARAFAGDESAAAKIQRQHKNQSTRGGRAGKGRPKRPHTELIRRAVLVLEWRGAEISPSAVKALIAARCENVDAIHGRPVARYCGRRRDRRGHSAD